VDVRNVAPRSSATHNIVLNASDMPGYTFFHDEWQIGWPDPVDPARFEGLQEQAKYVAIVRL